jgi:hypothetical protein
MTATARVFYLAGAMAVGAACIYALTGIAGWRLVVFCVPLGIVANWCLESER